MGAMTSRSASMFRLHRFDQSHLYSYHLLRFPPVAISVVPRHSYLPFVTCKKTLLQTAFFFFLSGSILVSVAVEIPTEPVLFISQPRFKCTLIFPWFCDVSAVICHPTSNFLEDLFHFFLFCYSKYHLERALINTSAPNERPLKCKNVPNYSMLCFLHVSSVHCNKTL